MTQLSFYFRQLLRQMWFLPAAFALAAVVTIGLAFYLARWAPEELPFTISQEAIQTILQILATSLLTVSVFALSTLVGALSSASASTTPRAVALIAGDRSAQTSISLFIGAFLFSILAILGLSAGIYSSAGRMLLFSVTLAVVALVVVALIRWIAQISDIGRVGHTVDRAEAATARALNTLRDHPLFDCRAFDGEAEGNPVYAEMLGYVQHFDATRLQRLATEHELEIVVTARPGTYVSMLRPLAMVQGDMDDELVSRLAGAFVVGGKRTFDNDPRFGLIVLAEIADRALSPGINDPGTAIDVLGTFTRLLANWHPGGGEDAPGNDRVFVAPLVAQDMLEDAFRPIARDGAGNIEVMLRLVHDLEIISKLNPFFREAALATAADAVERARKALEAPSDIRALADAAAFIENDIR